ncbi:ubiquitin-like protein 3 [Watersipora subatra]|uniref:ubiquitin-like protein 3 n=1 Tax=Watersipora subatra TaxID=2589382 RepID=UPI00355B064E
MTDDTDKIKNVSSRIPSDKVNLKVILVSACTKDFPFNSTDTVSLVTQHIYDNWPQDWPDDERPDKNILRLIYQGRFLHGNVSLAALQLPLGKTTVMHLVARETLPEPSGQGSSRKDKGQGSRSTRQRDVEQPGCCCIIS